MTQKISGPGPNPGLAALLGFIPGVGAMYNGQYAKGVVHLIIFAVLVSLADDHGIFGMFVAGWVFYQVFEAYQTAVARRDGTPLPNPFGLNDLGERLGFTKSWAPGAANVASSAPADAYTAPAGTYVPPAAPFTPPGPAPTQAPWETPWTNYVQPNYPPPANPYMNPPAFDPNAYPAPRNRFPAGAIWLIGLGVLFLVGNVGIFHGLPFHLLLPFFLIGLGVWIFVHKMTGTGSTLSDDGTAFYRMRLFAALRSSVWVMLVGVMFLLSNFHILSWGRSWPLFIILAGLMTFFERTAFHSTAQPAYPVPPYTPAPPASSSTSIVPSSTLEETPNEHNQEGR
jgi:TM2 domain-containing membrane protein YozV